MSTKMRRSIALSSVHPSTHPSALAWGYTEPHICRYTPHRLPNDMQSEKDLLAAEQHIESWASVVGTSLAEDNIPSSQSFLELPPPGVSGHMCVRYHVQEEAWGCP